MSGNITERWEVTIAGFRRGLSLREADRRCIIGLAAIALAAIGGHAYFGEGGGPGSGGSSALVDLSRPVDLDRVQRLDEGLRLDVNGAEWPEWTLLPRIGETLARRIVESRERAGRFESHADLRRVSGIGPTTLANIRPYLLPIDQAGEHEGRQTRPRDQGR